MRSEICFLWTIIHETLNRGQYIDKIANKISQNIGGNFSKCMMIVCYETVHSVHTKCPVCVKLMTGKQDGQEGKSGG